MVFFPMFAGITLMDPWRTINHWFFDAGSVVAGGGAPKFAYGGQPVEHAASRVAESQPDLWTVVQNKYKSGIHTSCANFSYHLFCKLVELSVPHSHSLKGESQLFRTPVREPLGISQLFLQCGCCSSLSPKVWSLSPWGPPAAKPHIGDAFLRSVPRPVILGDLSFCPHTCYNATTPPENRCSGLFFMVLHTIPFLWFYCSDTTKSTRLHQQDLLGQLIRFRTGLWTFVRSSEAQHEMHVGHFAAVFGSNPCW